MLELPVLFEVAVFLTPEGPFGPFLAGFKTL